MKQVPQEVLEEILDTLYLYGTSKRYFEIEIPSTGTTQAQDDAGQVARHMANKLEKIIQEGA